MKKLLMLSLVLTLLLTGCNAATTFGESITETTETTMTSTEITSTLKRVQTQIAGIYSLDQTPEEFLETLRTEEGIILKPNPNFPDYPDGRTVEWDGSFWYNNDVIRGNFTPEGQMTRLTVLSQKYTTDAGVEIGDAAEKVLAVYGGDYTQDEYENWYYYTEGDLSLGFYVPNGSVEWWRIFIPSLQPEEP